YDVRWNGSFYSGSRGCGGRIEPISVSLPATMASWSDVEVAGALGLLLNVGAPIGTDRLADNSAEFRGPPDASLSPYSRLAYLARPAVGGAPYYQAWTVVGPSGRAGSIAPRAPSGRAAAASSGKH